MDTELQPFETKTSDFVCAWPLCQGHLVKDGDLLNGDGLMRQHLRERHTFAETPKVTKNMCHCGRAVFTYMKPDRSDQRVPDLEETVKEEASDLGMEDENFYVGDNQSTFDAELSYEKVVCSDCKVDV